MDLLKRLIDAPSRDPEDHRRRRLLNILLIGTILATAAVAVALPIASAYGAAGESGEVMLLWISLVVVVPGVVVIYLVNRHLSPELAGILYVTLLLAVAAFSDDPAHVAKGRGLLVFAIPILASSVLIRPWASFPTAALACATVTAIAVFRVGTSPDFPVLLGFCILALVAYLAALSTERTAHRLRVASQELQAALDGTIRSLGATIELRDPYTAGHQRLVTELACAIAEKLGLEPDRIRGLQVAALAHDIGKISIPAEILSKPTRLNETEFSLIKEHPEAGSLILQDIAFPWPVAEIVRQHHERFDGSGYPRGLCGDRILLEARILAVADAVEAMAAHRPYRPALGIDAALREIQREAGTAYDPDVVVACCGLLASGQFTFGERAEG